MVKHSGITVVVIGGISILRAFEGLPVRVVLIARSAGDTALLSRVFDRSYVLKNPHENPALAVKKLIEISKRCTNKPVLYYADDNVQLFVSRNRQILLKYYRFLMPESELLEACVNKGDFRFLANKLALPVPRGLNICDISSDSDIQNNMGGYPIIIKPVLKEGRSVLSTLANGKPSKAAVAYSWSEAQRILQVTKESGQEFVIQEYIVGGEEQMYSFHAFVDKDFQPVEFYIGKKIRTYPAQSGTATFLELVDEPAVVDLGYEIVRKLRVVGPVKIDFKKDIIRNRFYLLELNLRNNLWNSLGAMCGINLVETAYKYLCEVPQIPRKEYKKGVCWLALKDDFNTFREDLAPQGEMTFLSWLLSLRRAKAYRVFSWKDPLPAILSSCRFWVSLLLKKTKIRK